MLGVHRYFSSFAKGLGISLVLLVSGCTATELKDLSFELSAEKPQVEVVQSETKRNVLSARIRERIARLRKARSAKALLAKPAKANTVKAKENVLSARIRERITRLRKARSAKALLARSTRAKKVNAKENVLSARIRKRFARLRKARSARALKAKFVKAESVNAKFVNKESVKAKEAVSTSDAFTDITQPDDKSSNSPWCRYLNANARAQTTILRSPTIAGDINQQGNGGVSISFDFVDLARARLKEQTAKAQCKRYLVSNRLARLMIVAPQSLTLAGNLAKANYLKSKRGQLNSIKRKIKNHIANGEMTVQLGTALIQHIATVASVEFRARAQALRRKTVGELEPGSTFGLNAELEEAERVLQDIGRRSRSFEALKVSISAGYGYQGDSGINANSGYGKIKLSYRLGAINPVREEYEDIAATARVDALSETNRGMLWRSSEMSKAVSRARSGLLAQRRQLSGAIAEARSNAALYVKGYEIEMLQPRYRAQIDAIALEAELRGINATLNDMIRVERNLNFR